MIVVVMDKQTGNWTAVKDESIVLKRERVLIDLTEWIERRYPEVPCYVDSWGRIQ